MTSTSSMEFRICTLDKHLCILGVWHNPEMFSYITFIICTILFNTITHHHVNTAFVVFDHINIRTHNTCVTITHSPELPVWMVPKSTGFPSSVQSMVAGGRLVISHTNSTVSSSSTVWETGWVLKFGLMAKQ